MAALTRHGTPVASVFDLLGATENDLTAALGFTLARAPALLEAVVRRVFPGATAADLDAASLAVEVRGEVGRTDLEITLPGALLIVEAKRDWLLPTHAQLRAYAPRVRKRGDGALITLSQASRELAQLQTPSQVDGVPVIHVSWRDVLTDLRAIRVERRGQERLWLDQLNTYLRRVVHLRPVADSWTYCVVLNDERPGNGGDHTFREFVTDEHAYFHPYGVGGWPTEPPNFMAFRWHGAVHRIHRVLRADVLPSLLDRWPDIPATADTVRPHAVYDLGPQLPPTEPIPSGASYRASRLWVLLDQLQTAPTLAAALAGSKSLADTD
ncbi:hypothetical protein [Paractinoplanes durhamensis]|uniref:PD-(D/E)XK nuclease superfamily protein n=1 Tax=Paractinoplanes durhamensis TaxID=113563 RepID=A0ABQ3Z0U5_9ACTN|nr:hypothetical protein [Actinoplanes durhamensis]GIE03450.1 hypothetical protein Adu01nite_48000 [Actinoplanes durhamensis]